MRICLLTNQDIDSPDFPEDDWRCDPRPFYPEAEWVVGYLDDKETAVEEVETLVDKNFDLFFNLCDGCESEEDNPGVEVVETLERLGQPYTGANPEFWEPTREKIKEVCHSFGINTPKSVRVSDDDSFERALSELNFPMFVKHYSSYASIDISRASKVNSEAGLLRQVNKIVAKHGAALVEEFIEGDECTVLVAENPQSPEHPIVFTPIKYIFPKGDTFKHESLKWDEDQFCGLKTVPVDDPVLATRLRKECADLFKGLNGVGFGRCDIRIDQAGIPYMLEINANCGIYYPEDAAGSADFILASDPAGHIGFTKLLIEAAFARHNSRN
ncbi:MAG: D-alanine--D-alanine ligase [Planctomycetota bacterium]|nr:D-alanine--D-alanine ligase [Planctomycetota bacterium]